MWNKSFGESYDSACLQVMHIYIYIYIGVDDISAGDERANILVLVEQIIYSGLSLSAHLVSKLYICLNLYKWINGNLK